VLIPLSLSMHYIKHVIPGHTQYREATKYGVVRIGRGLELTGDERCLPRHSFTRLHIYKTKNRTLYHAGHAVLFFPILSPCQAIIALIMSTHPNTLEPSTLWYRLGLRVDVGCWKLVNSRPLAELAVGVLWCPFPVFICVLHMPLPRLLPAGLETGSWIDNSPLPGGIARQHRP
jgi:hypothetical protein